MSYKVNKSTLVHSAKYFDVFKEDVTLPSGTQSDRTVVRHPGAVVILPMLSESDILFVKQYRHAVQSSILELPAGALEKGENPLSAAQRELAEEGGYQAEDWISLGTIYPAPGLCDEVQYAFLARGLSPKSLPPDDDEIIEPMPMSLSSTASLIASGEIKDAKTIAVIFRAQLLKLI